MSRAPDTTSKVNTDGNLCLAISHLFLIIYMSLGYIVRMAVCIPVALLGIMFRLVGRLTMPYALRPASTRINRRILVVTDYMPPQVHGIAVRCQNYVDYMRADGDEVVVFCTTRSANKLQSFDYPILPAIVNPLNTGNKICIGPCVLLAWHLGASSWDCVHVFFPSLIAAFILPICRLRGIPTYCSHHVDMDFYGPKYVGNFVGGVGNFIYWAMALLPARALATINAAPTLCFVKQHLPGLKNITRIPSGVEAGMVPAEEPEQRATEQEELRKRAGASKTAKLFVMVQRIAPEKGTDIALEAVDQLKKAGENVHLIVCGDGPSKIPLEKVAKQRDLPVTFLGAVPHAELPPIYRGADAFMSNSTSETFGLTLAEAMSCGTPAVMPEHPVFDELWADRVPRGWRYDPNAGPSAVADAMLAAVKGREWIAENPLELTWKDAARELVQQYDSTMKKQEGQAALNRRVWQCRKAMGMFAVMWTLMYQLKPASALPTE